MPSGVGGSIDLGLAGLLDVEEWKTDKAIETDDITDTGGQGWHMREGVLKDLTGSFNVVFKPSRMLETDLTLDVGDKVVATFKLGTTGKGYRGPLIIKTISTTNPAKGTVIRQSATFEATGPWIGPTLP